MRRVVLPLVVLALLAGTGLFLRSGHRVVSEPVPADFEYAVLEAGGVRLFGQREPDVDRAARGWTACGGRYSVDLERSGDALRVRLAFHPEPALLSCSHEPSGSDRDVQVDTGLFASFEGPAPTTVHPVGTAGERPVVDSRHGPVLEGPEWQRWVDDLTWAADGVPDAIGLVWDSPERSVHVRHATSFLGDGPATWLRTGDLGPELDYWRDAPRVGGDSFSIDGVEVRSVLRRWDTETHASLWTEDGRHVLDLDADAPIPEVRRLVRSLRVG